MKYSWGTAAFAYMYSSLDLACRGHSQICSCLFVLDVSVISCLLVLSILFSKILTLSFDRFGLMSSGYFLALLSIIHLNVGFRVFLDGSEGLLT